MYIYMPVYIYTRYSHTYTHTHTHTQNLCRYGLSSCHTHHIIGMTTQALYFQSKEPHDVSNKPHIKSKKEPPKNGKIALWPSTNLSIVHLLVLAGSLLIFTEIGEYKFISLVKARPQFQSKSVYSIVSWQLLLYSFGLCKTYISCLTMGMFDNSAICPFLGGGSMTSFL